MITITRTYCECTPESAEHGDWSDHGFVIAGYDHSLKNAMIVPPEVTASAPDRVGFRELVDLLTDRFTEFDSDDWASTEWGTTCYRTGTERRESIHFHRDQPARNRRWWNKAMTIAQQR